MSERARDRRFLLDAIELSRRAAPSQFAYSVGCVIVGSDERIVAGGYSRERGPQSHAEQVALERALEKDAILEGATLYTSLEPCSVRGSGLTPCARRIIEARIARGVFALREPPLFGEGRGADGLTEGGVEVTEIADEAARVREINAHLIR